MEFILPQYTAPDFSRPELQHAPLARCEPAPADGVMPSGYHATSVFPEYVQLEPGRWVLPGESRMDCVLVRQGDTLRVREFRHVMKGEPVIVGRRENGEDGIFVHVDGFGGGQAETEKFSFRGQISRESSFSVDYDELYRLLRHEKEHGRVVWVCGPAVVFDFDARQALVRLIRTGYVHALLAGNALAVHDMEAGVFRSALGRDIYSRGCRHQGHYNHLDVINTVRGLGSIRAALDGDLVTDGIMRTLYDCAVPWVLAGSIRDDGPLPDTLADAYAAQDRMREQLRSATTVIALATQLHTIAAGNMTPSYHVLPGGKVRPVYFYCVDMSEFVTTKLGNRGSVSARGILTNVQDFVVTVERGLNGCPARPE